MKSTVRLPVNCSRFFASSNMPRTSAEPDDVALSSLIAEPVIRAMMRASVVFPVYSLSTFVISYGKANSSHQSRVDPTKQAASISKIGEAREILQEQSCMPNHFPGDRGVMSPFQLRILGQRNHPMFVAACGQRAVPLTQCFPTCQSEPVSAETR
jgi:hypothetical protein